MDRLFYKILCLVGVVFLAAQCFAKAAGSPRFTPKASKPSTRHPAVMHGDLCARLNGRKFYLEPDASALLYAFNVTLPPLPKVAHALPRPPPRRHRRDESFNIEEEGEFRYKGSSNLAYKKHLTDSMNNHSSTTKLNEKNTTQTKNSKSNTPLQKKHGQRTENKMEEKKININSKDVHRMKSSIQQSSKSSLQQSSKSKDEKTTLMHKNKSLLLKGIEEVADTIEYSYPYQNNARDKSIKSVPDGFENTEDDFNDDERRITDDTRKFSANINGLSHLIDKNEHEMQMMRDQAEEQNADESDSNMVPALSRHLHCGIELFTCTECHLEFTFRKINLPSCSHDQTCRCDYLRLREPPYIASSGGLDVCSSGVSTVPTYTTQTREVSIDFFFTTNYRDAFTISVISKRNKYRILESSRNGSTGYIRSPFFPELYPKDYWVEYELLGLNENRRVKITFLDFQISPWSFVEVQDTNESRLAVFSGNIFRPPVLTSSGPQITIRFNANGETARGFNLQYSFISKDSPAMIPPMSDCGGYVTNFGGTITMMNMAKGAGNATLYDCVWIIQPPQNFAFKTHVFIKVVQFEEMAARASIEIRQGLTSDDYLLETITGGEKQTTSKEHVVSVDTGFYVRLQGFFSRDTKVAIVYTSFSVLGNCYAMTDHMCHNHRCIPKMLRCDGFDHCGDGSDEPNSCYGGVPGEHHLTPEDQAWWYQHTPNYYFPQKTRLFANPYGSSMMLLFSLFVLILIIIGLVSYMARQGNQDAINNRRHRDRTHRERNNGVNDGVEIFDAAADDPPSYEHPPDYEEVIKFILSGNNLKLIRRPGGLTAWMPDIPKMQNNSSFERNADGSLRNPQIQWLNQGNEAAQQLVPHQSLSVQRPLRTRHASLDMEQAEVVLWNSNANHLSDELSRPDIVRQHSTPLLPSLHTRRSSLPSAPQPELMQAYTSNRDSMGPATIVEIPEGADSPLLGSRIIIPPSQMSHSSSVNPTISNSNNNSLYESGEISSESTTNLLNMSNDQSSPGPSTRNASSKTVNLRKTKSKNGGKRRKTSAVKKSMRRKREEEAAPPSYEMAMQQSSQNSNSPLSDSTGTQTESTQIAQPEIDNDIDLNTNPEASISEQIVTVAESSLLPSQRIKSAREKFQKLSANENAKYGELSTIRESLPSNVSFRSTKIRSPRNGGTISKGTVKARKAMLMRARTPSPSPYVECICNGACSCANFKNGSEMIDDCVSSGAVKSKVDYYLKIKEQLKNEEYDSPEELVKNDIKDTCKSSKIKSKNSPYNKKKAFLRNKSIPHPQLANNHDLDIYFSQDNSSFVQNTIDITDKIIKMSKYENEVMNVASTSKAKEIDDISYKFVGNAEKEENPKSSDVKQVSSIRKHVHLYNELAKNKEVQSVDSPSLLNSENGQAVICMHVLKSNTLDSEIKAGIVKDTKEKYIASTIMDTEGNKLSISQDTSDIEDEVMLSKQYNQDANYDVQQQNLSIITNEQTQEHLEEEEELSVDLNECLIKDKGIFDHSTKSNTENSQKIDSIDETDFHESMSEEENENSITENLPLIAKHCKSRKLEKKEVKGIDKEGNDYNEGCTSEEFEKNTPTLAILSDAEELKTDIDLSCIESINDSISTIDSIDNHLSEPEKNYNINFIPDQCEIKNDSMKKLPTNKGSNSINTKEESLSSQTQTLIKNEEKTQNILQGVNKTTQPIVSVSPSKESPSSFTKKDLDLECSPIKSFIRDDIEQNSEFYIIKDIKEADTSSMSMSSRSNSPYDITEEIIDPITEYIKETEPQHDENKISISPTSCDNYSTAYLNLTSSSSPRQNLRQIPHQTEEEILPSDQDCTQITDVNTRSGIIVVKDGSQIRWDYI